MKHGNRTISVLDFHCSGCLPFHILVFAHTNLGVYVQFTLKVVHTQAVSVHCD